MDTTTLHSTPANAVTHYYLLSMLFFICLKMTKRFLDRIVRRIWLIRTVSNLVSKLLLVLHLEDITNLFFRKPLLRGMRRMQGIAGIELTVRFSV